MAQSNRMVTVELRSAATATYTSSATTATSSSHRAISYAQDNNDPSVKENLKGFMPLVGLIQVLGLLPLFMIIYWIFHYAGGLKFPTSRSVNWHIVLLCISFIYLNGNSLLTFRILRNQPKDTLKLIHAIGQSVSCILAMLGIWAAFPSKGGFFSYYTLHSWIGILTVIVYIAQTIAGLYSFLYPGIANKNRALLMPYHRFIGQILLVLAVVAVVSGINEKAMFKLEKTYKDQSFEAILLNLSGVLFTLFVIFVIYIVSNVDYKRYPRLQDNMPSRNKL
ncbi:uncharacterized protein LOC135843732 isoform X2 [Planococcus citri]|uniref:uncharacterized protein LOC135843732 isoform X2 n=1 Tax=Planococcus citri TaxID=170843 RepID=UPI0031F9F8BA